MSRTRERLEQGGAMHDGGPRQRLLYRAPFNFGACLECVVNAVSAEVPTAGLPQVGWCVGDGIAPSYWKGVANTANRLTLTGTPTAAATPFFDVAGTAIQSETYNGSSYRATATVVDPSAGQDIVVAVLARRPHGTGNLVFLSTRHTGGGWMVYNAGSTMIFQAYDGTTNRLSTATVTEGAWFFMIGIVKIGDNVWNHLNGGAAQGVLATPANLVGNGEGFAVAARPNGSLPMNLQGALGYGVGWYAAGIAGGFTQTFVSHLTRVVLGYERQTGRAVTTFARASIATVETDGALHIMSAGAPRSGCLEGYFHEGTADAVNKCYNNKNPSVTTGLAESGGTLTAEDDSTALDAAEVYQGPNAFKFIPGGGAEHVACGAATGNTNKHSLSVRLRVAAGSTAVEIGWDLAGAFTKISDITATAGYVQYKAEDVTPNNVGDKWAIKGAAGATLHFVLQHLEESTTVSSEIINVATAATATRKKDEMTLPADVGDAAIANGWNLNVEGRVA